MKFTCTQENLKRALSIVERVTSKNTTLPILENILMETKGGLIQLSATNLEIGIITSFGAKIDIEGKVALPVKVFGDFISNLPEENQIVCKADQNRIELESGSYRATIRSFDPQDFPIIPQPNAPHVSIRFSAQRLKKDLTKTMISISPNATRIEFSGVCMLFGQKEVYAVSTDSFRLSEVRIPCEYSSGYSDMLESIIVPHHTISELLRLLESGRENIVMNIEGGQVFFLLDNDVFLVSRLINGKFPDYKQIIPQKIETGITLLRDEFQRAVKLANIFSSEKAAEVSLDIQKGSGRVTFSSESSQSGSNVSHISCPVEGVDQKILLNPRYILDALSTNAYLSVKIGVNGAASPVVFHWLNERGEQDDSYQYILMPIKK